MTVCSLQFAVCSLQFTVLGDWKGGTQNTG